MEKNENPVVRMKVWLIAVPATVITCTINAWLFFNHSFLPVRVSMGAIAIVVLAYFLPLPEYMRQPKWTKLQMYLFVAQVLTSALFIILLYAEIYVSVGLDKGSHFQMEQNGVINSIPNPTKAPEDCLYFSLVTWTTLGYGDVQATNNFCRFTAASEAFLQIIYLGLFIAVVTHIFQQVKASVPHVTES